MRERRCEFVAQQSESLKTWDAENLIPLVEACDHKYPWGEDAVAWKCGMPIAGEPGMGQYGDCKICY